MKQAKNYELKYVKKDFANFLDFYLSQTMSLEQMDDWAKRLQKKWDFKNEGDEYEDELKKG
jgi:hypothetical protein|tara:strand:+ start:426 stop:608 length:183 start_codon:yes stop_codon:yes gene_type:complete